MADNLSDINQIEFCGQILMEVPTIIFHENLSSGRRVVSFGQRHAHDETNSPFSQLRKWPMTASISSPVVKI